MRFGKLITKLDWYIASQLFTVILFAIVLFSIIFLAPETLLKLSQYFFSGKITLSEAGVMFLYHLPEVLQQVIPMAVLLGSIFLFQRLTQNYELIACLASGISPARLMVAVLWGGLFFGGLHVLVQEALSPVASARLNQIYLAKGQSEETRLRDIEDQNFLFVEKNHQGQLSKFFMIGQINKPLLRDFIILYYDETPDHGVQISRILRARSGWWRPEQNQWELANGIEYVLNDEGVYKDIRSFAKQQIRTDRYASILLDYTRLNPKAMPWGQLNQYIRLLKEGGQLYRVPYYEVRLWQKWSGPVATVIFAILGALLGMERVRTNRTFGLTFGALVIFMYSILASFASNFGSLDVAAPWLVAWMPLAVAILTTAVIMKLRPRSG